MTVVASATEFSSEGGEGRLTVTAERDCSWDVRTDATWLTITTTGEVQGNGTAAFVVAPTTDPVARTASLTIGEQHIAITQRAAACRYRLSKLDVSVPAPGGGADVDVTASSALCEWTAQSGADWVSIPTGRTYKGNARVTMQAPPWSGAARRADIAVADQHVVLTQSGGCTFTIAPSSAAIARTGGRSSATVQAGPGCGWSSVSSVPWVSITAGAAGNGPGAVEFAVDANTGPARTATLMIANQPFAISQASGCEYRLDPASWTFAAAGGPGGIAVNTAIGCSWTAASDADWMTITSGHAGSGPGTLQISVAANSGPQRSAGINVNGQRFVATQLSGCTYSINPTSWGFPAEGAADWVWVTATPGCFWTTSSQASWLTITTGSAGYGSAITYFVVAPNPGGPRSGTMTIAGYTFTALQARR
jgi:hypothetical protein